MFIYLFIFGLKFLFSKRNNKKFYCGLMTFFVKLLKCTQAPLTSNFFPVYFPYFHQLFLCFSSFTLFGRNYLEHTVYHCSYHNVPSVLSHVQEPSTLLHLLHHCLLLTSLLLLVREFHNCAVSIFISFKNKLVPNHIFYLPWFCVKEVPVCSLLKLLYLYLCFGFSLSIST